MGEEERGIIDELAQLRDIYTDVEERLPAAKSAEFCPKLEELATAMQEQESHVPPGGRGTGTGSRPGFCSFYSTWWIKNILRTYTFHFC